jgi:uncharacterized protein (DUF924 family)
MALEPPWTGAVLRFWFEELTREQWFARDRDLDALIRDRFLKLYEDLVEGDAAGISAPRALLAAVIALDQFPRNMFRDTPRAYAVDWIARRLSMTAIGNGFDAGMTADERSFLYLPFQHSEDREDQALSLHLYERLGNEEWTRFAKAHKDIIDRFGRFPHRNATLGRTSTPKEIALLEEPMGSF